MINKYNYRMLSLSREYRGLKQQELSEKIGISQSNLSKYENGISDINDFIVDKYANILNFNSVFFERNYIPVSGYINYRKLKKLNATSQLQLESIFNIIISNLELVFKEIELPKYDYFQEPNEAIRPEEIANIVRQKLNIPLGPIPNLTNVLEMNGIIIIEIESDSDFDSAAKKHNDLRIIFVNKNLPADRYRFTIAHELGHLTMHNYYNDEILEKEAHTFASELLMPTDIIKYDFDEYYKLGTRQLEELKYKWLTSMQSIAYKAKALNKLNDDDINKIYKMLHSNKKIKGKQEILQFRKEEPKLLWKICEFYKQELGYNDDDMGKLFGLKYNDYSKLFNYTPQAKIIKLKNN